jgi:hypothetical protein
MKRIHHGLETPRKVLKNQYIHLKSSSLAPVRAAIAYLGPRRISGDGSTVRGIDDGK